MPEPGKMLDTDSGDRVVVVLAGGDPPPAWVAGELPENPYVIAADSGLSHARQLALSVHLLVGDLDSVTEADRRLHPEAQVVAYSPDKDKTDLELALEAAVALDPARVIVVGGSGGRLDHLLGNAALLAADKFADTDITWLGAGSTTHVVRAAAQIHGSAGDLVSLLPYGGPAIGVRTRGLRWALDEATLTPGTTWGISNRMTGPVAQVRVREGILLVVHTATDLPEDG